ncbi:MAG TPA: hypothetical protein VFW27_03470 [Actinoplanes sp.]|nr:hypothetical protein [Actinoplanes sp.]
MTHDFAVHTYGVDSSGRAILMTAYMHDWFEGVVDALGWRPTIVQGAFMSRVPGGGASTSAGYHDLGGCLDLRVWDLTADASEQLVRTLRRHGAAAWRRDHEHGGMDPHCHLTLGTDAPLTHGAAQQWTDYQHGYDGLAGRGPDYEWRPNPLVLKPPEDDMTPAQAKQLDGLTKAVASLADMVEALAEGNEAIKRRITKAKREVIAAVEADQ